MAAFAVTVHDLSGNELQYEMVTLDTVASLRSKVAEAWSLDPRAFRLLTQSSDLLQDEDRIADFCSTGPLQAQLVKFDPLLELGQFVAPNGTGIAIKDDALVGKDSTLIKTSETPDSNNVFLRHEIREPCFAEFRVTRSGDELSIGVTYDKDRVETATGYQNLQSTSTWLYSKHKAMPTLLLGGKKLGEGTQGIMEGDIIAVFADPHERLVKFYNNGKLVASNLPDYPLPVMEDRPLRMYVMLDRNNDEVSVVRFGPGDAYRPGDGDGMNP